MKNSFTWAAFFTSLVALTGSLLLSWELQLKACPLCLYQRTFVMGVVGVLGVGLCVGGLRPGLLSLLALPLAFGGLAVAGFHLFLVHTGALECPHGLFALGLAPTQSLMILVLLTLFLVSDILRSGSIGGFSWLTVPAPAILGLLLGFAAIKSAPPPPPVPPGGYPKPVDEDGCRPPYRQPGRTAVTAIILAVSEDNNTVEAGQRLTYEIKATNSGSQVARNVEIKAFVPREMRVTETSSPSKENIADHVVTFDKMDIQANQSATYKIGVEAEQPGDVRLRVELRSQDLRWPVVEEEPTRITPKKN